MKRIYVGAAVAAALGLTGLSAHAGCVDPRVISQLAASQKTPRVLLQAPVEAATSNSGASAFKIVGTWHVIYTTEGSPGGEAFIQWHSDGTEFENINFPVLGGNICVGSWKAVDATHVHRSHIGWLYSNGLLSGYFTETERDEVGVNGNSYKGTNDMKIYDLDGNLQVELTGTSYATRLPP